VKSRRRHPTGVRAVTQFGSLGVAAKIRGAIEARRTKDWLSIALRSTTKALAGFRKRAQHVAARFKSSGQVCPGGNNTPNSTKTVEEDA